MQENQKRYRAATSQCDFFFWSLRDRVCTRLDLQSGKSIPTTFMISLKGDAIRVANVDPKETQSDLSLPHSRFFCTLCPVWLFRRFLPLLYHVGFECSLGPQSWNPRHKCLIISSWLFSFCSPLIRVNLSSS